MAFTMQCIITWGDRHMHVTDITVWCDPNESDIISRCVKTVVNKIFNYQTCTVIRTAIWLATCNHRYNNVEIIGIVTGQKHWEYWCHSLWNSEFGKYSKGLKQNLTFAFKSYFPSTPDHTIFEIRKKPSMFTHKVKQKKLIKCFLTPICTQEKKTRTRNYWLSSEQMNLKENDAGLQMRSIKSPFPWWACTTHKPAGTHQVTPGLSA